MKNYENSLIERGKWLMASLCEKINLRTNVKKEFKDGNVWTSNSQKPKSWFSLYKVSIEAAIEGFSKNKSFFVLFFSRLANSVIKVKRNQALTLTTADGCKWSQETFKSVSSFLSL